MLNLSKNFIFLLLEYLHFVMPILTKLKKRLHWTWLFWLSFSVIRQSSFILVARMYQIISLCHPQVFLQCFIILSWFTILQVFTYIIKYSVLYCTCSTSASRGSTWQNLSQFISAKRAAKTCCSSPYSLSNREIWHHSYINDVRGPPDGHRLDINVGRIWSTPIRCGSWDPIGSCPPIKYQIQVKLEQRLSTLSCIQ